MSGDLLLLGNINITVFGLGYTSFITISPFYTFRLSAGFFLSVRFGFGFCNTTPILEHFQDGSVVLFIMNASNDGAGSLSVAVFDLVVVFALIASDCVDNIRIGGACPLFPNFPLAGDTVFSIACTSVAPKAVRI